MIQENVPKTPIILILSVLEQENERHWSTSEIQKLIEKHHNTHININTIRKHLKSLSKTIKMKIVIRRIGNKKKPQKFYSI